MSWAGFEKYALGLKICTAHEREFSGGSVDSILFRNRIVVVDPGSSLPPCADVPSVVPARTRVPAFSRLASLSLFIPAYLLLFY